MLQDIPLFILALTVSAYWATVALLALAKRLRHGRSAGFFPTQSSERWLWLLIVPVVFAWMLLPVLGLRGISPWLRPPSLAERSMLISSVRWAAAMLGLGCYVLSLSCWLVLGRRWSMAIVPGNSTQLVRKGLYRWVRHPIYALSVTLMLASVLVMLTIPMVVVASLHLLAMNLKARYEEGYLTSTLGPEYHTYCKEVGRFWPRLSA